MAIQEIFIQVRFTEDTKYGEYHDALYFDQQEFSFLPQKDIDDLVEARVNDWVSALDNMVPGSSVTKEELILELGNLDADILELQRQKNELQDKTTNYGK